MMNTQYARRSGFQVRHFAAGLVLFFLVVGCGHSGSLETAGAGATDVAKPEKVKNKNKNKHKGEEAAAASSDATPVPTGPVPSIASSLDKFEYSFLQQPKVRELILFNGREYGAKVSSDGAFGKNGESWTGKGELNIEGQRNSYFVIAAGILAPPGSERTALLDKGLKSIEWGLSKQKSDGTFPGKDEKPVKLLHPWSMFLQSAARSIILIRQTPDIDPQIRNRAEALIPKLKLSVSWIANSGDLDKFIEKTGLTNQIINIALSFHETGLVANDPALIEKGKAVVMGAIGRQTADGTIPEKDGFDSSYQTFSLEMLTRYAALTKDQALQNNLLAALNKGWAKFRSNVRDDGLVSSKSNTRTQACGARVPGNGPKGKNIDIMPLRVYYYGYLVNQMAVYGPLADKIQQYGQGFDHANTCSPLDSADTSF